LPSWAVGFRGALARVDARSLAAFAVPFFEAAVADQDALLAQWINEAEGVEPEFVRNLVTATLEGILGDPIYGGNLDGNGWKAFGLHPDPFSPSEIKKR
jgi:hypothetical protein